MKRKNWKSLFFLFLLLVFLPVFVFLVQQVQNYLSKASGAPANLIVETQTFLGPLSFPWQAFSQGGEEKEQRLNNVINAVKPLSPRYIRLDHLFDQYELVKGTRNGGMSYDFSKLDLIVNDILSTGAKPFFSLSYMPPVISSGDLTATPENWFDWQNIIKAFIEHYSGINGKNITDVYYEVWNEPDLFGHWKIYGEKDYRLLYRYSVQGASEAVNVNNFKIGGPAITAYYPAWFKDFLTYIKENNLRLDFLSWHTYSPDPDRFLAEINSLEQILENKGFPDNFPKLITEFGSDPENNVIHDTQFDAAHTAAVLRQILGKIDYAFTFEIRDGLSPLGKEFWGRWGILTNNLTKKPRYFVFSLLNKMTGQRLKVTGEGTYVTAFAGKETRRIFSQTKFSVSTQETIRLFLINYDPRGIHTESFPITFSGLTPGNYLLKSTNLYGEETNQEITVITDNYSQLTTLSPNSVLLLELQNL